jgi:hypothetical protein
VTINIAGLQKINFDSSDGYDYVQLFADGNNCQFTFQDGDTILVTETRIYQTFGVEQVSVVALGAGGVASFFDLPSHDTFTLRSNLVLFEGGGYRIEARDFQTADVYPIYGGNNTAKVYGENNSRIFLADYLVQRLDVTTSYRIWNTNTVIAFNADETNNTITFLNMTPREEYHIASGYVSVSNAQRNTIRQAIGFNNVAISQFAGGSCSIIIYMRANFYILPQDGNLVLTDGTQKVLMPFNAIYTYHQDEIVSPDRSVPVSTPFASSSPAAAVDSLYSQSETLVEPENILIANDISESSLVSLLEESGNDWLLNAMAWEQLQKDRSANATTDNSPDDETDLLRLFARRIALMQIQ